MFAAMVVMEKVSGEVSWNGVSAPVKMTVFPSGMVGLMPVYESREAARREHPNAELMHIELSNPETGGES